LTPLYSVIHTKKRLKERHEKREGERLKERRERVIAWVGVTAMNSECVTVRVCVFKKQKLRLCMCVGGWKWLISSKWK
jgi:hypothetical protein